MTRRYYSLLSAAVAVATVLPAAASAQNDAGAAGGALGGAAAGAAIGGPAGAAVGGAIGAIIGGTITPPPPPVVTFVTAQPPPPTVTLQGTLVVGATLPETVVLTPIPPDVYVVPAGGVVYGYAVVNDQRVIVDTNTRAVVAIVG